METPRPDSPVDLLVVGAGPIGLACALEAERVGLTARVVEKGSLVNSLVGYPTQMEFFSTPELLEIGGHPLATTYYKPRREEAIDYYRSVSQREGLDVRLGERVLEVEGDAGDFEVVTSKGRHRARAVAIATGFFDQPNRLGVPGEDLDHVSHYYKEPYPFSGRRVVVVGAKNSAAKAALEIHRHGGHVTMVVRGDEITTSVKYWLRPDLLNRIKEGSIDVLYTSTVESITPDSVHVQTPDGPLVLPADAVLALIGYHPDFGFLERLGLDLEGDARAPVVDDATMESSRPGVFLAGTVCGGYATSRWFIENGRIHAARIAASLAGLPAPALEAVGQP
ncbi:YpdA family putative bacillithiol disulfide reductase [Rubrivirga sp.]|uniref:YpdA family putative bacillithiol disulfide reductase n=1 Tax=Rubrivirga sp. TaxID=1885344 RepID=UPI003C76D031